MRNHFLDKQLFKPILYIGLLTLLIGGVLALPPQRVNAATNILVNSLSDPSALRRL